MGLFSFLFSSGSDSEEKQSNDTDEQKKKKEEKKREWKDTNEKYKFVCEAGKIKCQYCSTPFSPIKVTSNDVSLQDVPYMTAADNNGKVNLNFTGDCLHPKSPKANGKPLPCKMFINLLQWRDTSETFINNGKAIIVNSKIGCTVSSSDLTVEHSGQKAVVNEVKPVTKAVVGSVIVGRVIRGNPYVPKNARNTGLPDSVPLNKTYEVEIEVKGTGTVDLAIINSSGDNGNATVSPTSITATTKVTITGAAKTKPGHAGQLKIEAKVDGKVKGTSQGFSVCCHPINYTDTYVSDIDQPNIIGFVVQDGWSSDNGTFSDLNDTKISELVIDIKSDSPPFTPLGSGTAINSSYLRGDSLTKDRHFIGPRPIAGPAGTMEFGQLCIYKCACCGCEDIVLPSSGFKIIHEVFQVGTQWKHRIRKIGEDMVIVTPSRTHSTRAGNANAVSPDHNLP